MSSHVGICRANVGTTLGLSWLILSHFGPHWDHIGPMMSHFGLCAGLYLVKNTVNAQKKTAFLGCVADVFDAILNYIFSFLLGHAALRLCWPYLKLMLSKNSIHVGLLLRPLEPMLGRCRAVMSGHCPCQLCSVGCCVLVKDGVASACQ